MRENVAARNRLVGNADMKWQDVLADLRRAWPRLQPLVADVSLFLHRAIARGEARHVRGRAGHAARHRSRHLSVRHLVERDGRRRCHRTRRRPRAIGAVLGVAKAYTTRVGDGPLPTELTGAMGERLRETGQEYGASTGRPRRCGWYDAVAVRYAARVNGLDALALTKLDVLDGLDRAAGLHGLPLRRRSADRDARRHGAARRVRAGLRDAARLDAADARRDEVRRLAARKPQRYIRRLEETSGVPAAIVSTGSDRDHTIIRADLAHLVGLA